MQNILSFTGISLHTELCIWTMFGIIRGIFDTTIFRINSELKQVWQVNIPDELSKSMHRILRLFMSGLVLMRGFTAHLYLATYIVLLYPLFLEEKPLLLLPWLVAAAIRRLLTELVSLSLGLGLCILLGPSRPACVVFVLVKIGILAPTVYMWYLVLTYYKQLKTEIIIEPVTESSDDVDYQFEQAVRRRKTKSLFDEEALRDSIIRQYHNQKLFTEHLDQTCVHEFVRTASKCTQTSESSTLEVEPEENSKRMSFLATEEISTRMFGVLLRKDVDRVLEQFTILGLSVAEKLNQDNREFHDNEDVLNEFRPPLVTFKDDMQRSRDNMLVTPGTMGSNGIQEGPSYVRRYPAIFKKHRSDSGILRVHDQEMDDFNDWEENDDESENEGSEGTQQ